MPAPFLMECTIKVKATQLCPTLCYPMEFSSPWNSLGQNTGVGSHSLLWGIFPTQGSNPGFPHCRQILYHLSHQGSLYPTSHVRLFVTPWTIQSMEFSRSEYWSGQPFPSPRDLPKPGIKPRFPALQLDSLLSEPPKKPKNTGVGSLFLLQRSFPIQESNWGLLLCR